MKISLITATLGRYEELVTLFESLKKQTYKNFELYLVDQNNDSKLKDLSNDYQKYFSINYIHSTTKGLSLNRNIALKLADGDIIGFPDDDCYYSPDVLSNVIENLENTDDKIKFCAMRTFDSVTKKQNHKSDKIKIEKNDVLKKCISYNVFVKRNDKVLFDERLGVGSYYSSGEETDFLYSIIENKNHYGIFINQSGIYHPSRASLNIDNERIYKYSLGFGALMKKDYIIRNNINSLFVFIYYILRSLGGYIKSLGNSKYYHSLKGKFNGFISFNP